MIIKYVKIINYNFIFSFILVASSYYMNILLLLISFLVFSISIVFCVLKANYKYKFLKYNFFSLLIFLKIILENFIFGYSLLK